jgi:hypothetical protein
LEEAAKKKIRDQKQASLDFFRTSKIVPKVDDQAGGVMSHVLLEKKRDELRQKGAGFRRKAPGATRTSTFTVTLKRRRIDVAWGFVFNVENRLRGEKVVLSLDQDSVSYNWNKAQSEAGSNLDIRCGDKLESVNGEVKMVKMDLLLVQKREVICQFSRREDSERLDMGEVDK